MLTYVNYSFVPYREFLPVVVVEYVFVFSLLVFEYRKFGVKVEG